MEFYDLNDDNVIQTILDDVYSTENDLYRYEIDKQWRILRGDLKHFVERDLKRVFPKTYQSFTAGEINLAKKITEKRAAAYKETPKRTLSNESESDRYDEILKDVGAKWVWRDFDTYKNHFKYAAMWFSFYEENGEQRVKLRALRPNQFSRIVDDKDRTKVFIVHMGNSHDSAAQVRGDNIKSVIQDEPEDNQTRTVAIWTETQHVVVHLEKTKQGVRFQRQEVEGNEERVNELGVIPALFDQEGSEMEKPALNSLSDQTLTLNFIMSVIITGMASQSFGQLVISHPDEQTIPENIQQGLFTFLKLPQVGQDAPATTADYISPSPDLASMMETYRLYALSTLDEHGVKGGEAIKGSAQEFSSGIDRLLSQMDTTEVIEANQQSYAEKEQELFELFKIFYSLNGSISFSTDEVQVQYKKPRPMQSDAELMDNIQKKLDLGLIEEWEKFVIIDPNLSPDDARKKLELINAEKKTKMEGFLNEAKKEQDDTNSESFEVKPDVPKGEEQSGAQEQDS